jgi:hypothetical protein
MHISSAEVFSKILKKPSDMNGLLVFIEMKQKKKEKRKIQNGRLKKTSFSSSANF